MAPQPALLTPRTALRPRPGVVALLFKNLLEFDHNKKYHPFISKRIRIRSSVLERAVGPAKNQPALSLFYKKNGPQPKGPFNPIISLVVSN
jgi:hypothetical protein